MPYGYGYGFRGASPPWPYIGRGRGGLPRCGYFFSGSGAPLPWPYQSPAGAQAASEYSPYSHKMTGEDELNYLKEKAEAIKGQLEEIESRICDLGKGGK